MTDGYRLIPKPFPNPLYLRLPVNWGISRDLQSTTYSAAVDKRP